MNPIPSQHDHPPAHAAVCPPSTVAAARQWLEKVACEAGATLTIRETIPDPRSALVIVQGVLERPDGHRVNLAVQCIADRRHTDRSDLFPLLTEHGHRSSVN